MRLSIFRSRLYGADAECAVGKAIAIRLGFGGFNVLLRAYQRRRFQLFQFQTCSVTIRVDFHVKWKIALSILTRVESNHVWIESI
jgi:hypothetical protein